MESIECICLSFKPGDLIRPGDLIKPEDLIKPGDLRLGDLRLGDLIKPRDLIRPDLRPGVSTTRILAVDTSLLHTMILGPVLHTEHRIL